MYLLCTLLQIYLFFKVFHMFFSYLITEILILQYLYLDDQFRYKGLKNIRNNK